MALPIPGDVQLQDTSELAALGTTKLSGGRSYAAATLIESSSIDILVSYEGIEIGRS